MLFPDYENAKSGLSIQATTFTDFAYFSGAPPSVAVI